MLLAWCVFSSVVVFLTLRAPLLTVASFEFSCYLSHPELSPSSFHLCSRSSSRAHTHTHTHTTLQKWALAYNAYAVHGLPHLDAVDLKLFPDQVSAGRGNMRVAKRLSLFLPFNIPSSHNPNPRSYCVLSPANERSSAWSAEGSYPIFPR